MYERGDVTEGDRRVTLGNRSRDTLGHRIAGQSEEEQMRRSEGPDGSADRGFVPFLLAAGALLSPALQLWVAPGMPWWTLYAVWGAIIAAAAVAARRES